MHHRKFDQMDESEMLDYITIGTDDRIYAIAELLRRGCDEVVIASLTKIDILFINKLKNIIDMEKTLLEHPSD